MPRPLLAWTNPAPPLPRHQETFTVSPPTKKTSPVRLVEREVEEVETETFVASVVPETLPPRLHILVSCNADREDLLADQRLPARFVVLDPQGQELARFHGCEHATKFARLTGWHAVVRLEDGLPMTNVQIPKGWAP